MYGISGKRSLEAGREVRRLLLQPGTQPKARTARKQQRRQEKGRWEAHGVQSAHRVQNECLCQAQGMCRVW